MHHFHSSILKQPKHDVSRDIAMAGVAPAGLKTRASACAQCVERCRNEHGTGDISSITKKVNPAAIPTRHPCFIKTLLENGFRSWMVCESSSKSSCFVCRYILANLFALEGYSQDYIQSVTNEPCRIITVWVSSMALISC